MAEKKQNPLLGAFRTPAPGAAPPGATLSGKLGEEKKPPDPPKVPADSKIPATGTAIPGKLGEEKKPAEQTKAPADGKIPATGTAIPGKLGEEKKPAEQTKAPADGKTPATTPTTPGKPGEEKRPDEQAKAPADGKTPTTGTVTPGKPSEGKKPDEQPKVPADGKAPPTGTVTPGKPSEGKKPDEPPKAPTDGKTPATGTAIPGKPVEEKKPDEPPKVPADGKAPPTGTAAPGKPGEEKKPDEQPKIPTDGKPPATEPDADLPKNMKVPIAPEGGGETVTTAKLSELHPFDGHPYSVKDDKEMWDLVESVKRSGVIEPVMVIRDEKKGGYEIVSGHRRHRASQLAGLDTIPVLIRKIDRDSAIIAMVDANLKREDISPMEKARAYAMKLEALKRTAGRLSKADILNGAVPKRADEQVAEEMGESRATVQRTARLTKLVPELQDMVDEKKLPVNTGADISYLKPDEQKKLADAIEKEGGKVPSGTQAAALKEASKKGELTTEKIESTVAPTKREENPSLKITLTEEELRPYFPNKRTTVPEAKRGVLEALDLRARALERKAKAAEAEKPKKPPAPAR